MESSAIERNAATHSWHATQREALRVKWQELSSELFTLHKVRCARTEVSKVMMTSTIAMEDAGVMVPKEWIKYEKK
jgi:hypothetical protein